jgi:hypothetical protein
MLSPRDQRQRYPSARFPLGEEFVADDVATALPNVCEDLGKDVLVRSVQQPVVLRGMLASMGSSYPRGCRMGRDAS